MKKLECMVYNLYGNQMKKIILIIIFLSISLYGQNKQDLFFPSEKQLLKSEKWEQNFEFDSPEIQLLEPQKERKSVAKAFIYSLLIPGMGEAYVGRTGYTKIFMSLEVLGWGLLIGNYEHVSWLQNDYKNYARQHADVSQGSKDDGYWIDIGKYDVIYEYNEQRRRDRDVDAIYEENAINYWRWDTHSNRLDYDGRRIHSRELEQNEVYYIGGIVLNHLVSAINALRVAKAYNRNLNQDSWQMGVKLDSYQKGISLSFNQPF